MRNFNKYLEIIQPTLSVGDKTIELDSNDPTVMSIRRAKQRQYHIRVQSIAVQITQLMEKVQGTDIDVMKDILNEVNQMQG